ncbi:MAG TPA: hypothetical protein ENN80_08475 [Candidatus Hydrogenedentes bacterium]|nr:hypothetical protein [Candidatus Hydrogenedentota bacterium]
MRSPLFAPCPLASAVACVVVLVMLLFAARVARSEDAGALFGAHEFSVGSTLDGSEQKVLAWAPRGAEADSPGVGIPLLVSMHTWSTDYASYDGIEQVMKECRARGWVCISPSFRGPNARPEACGSDLVAQDIRDAVLYACSRYRVDPQRIYLVGVSGGGHAALVMAHRARELWAGVSAWVPVTDLAAWHAFCIQKGLKYARDIEACVPHPVGSTAWFEECRKRSPVFWLDRAKGLAIDIQAGIHDGHEGSIPVDHTLRAFNILARANGYTEAVVAFEDIDFMRREGRVPHHLSHERVDEPGRAHAVLFRRQAGAVRVTLFDGGHEIDPAAAIAWLAEQRKGRETGLP